MRARPEILAYVRRELPGAAIEPLAGDASTRRFFRLRLADGTTRILMDYGSPFQGETDDVRLSRVFETAALPVARIHDVRADPGCLLLEDLGRRSLEQAVAACGSGVEPAAFDLLRRGVVLAAQIAVRGTPVLARCRGSRGPALDAERFSFEMDFFLQHFARGLRRLRRSPDELRPALQRLAARAARSPRRVLCHRDFHSRNLILRHDGTLAMVDIQDARWGPDSYDLTSLLRDAYVPIDEDWIDPLVRVYLEHVGDIVASPETFADRFELVSAQRMLKALGTFGYQVAVLGQRRYLEGIPRTLQRLERLLPRREDTAELHELLHGADLLTWPEDSPGGPGTFEFKKRDGQPSS